RTVPAAWAYGEVWDTDVKIQTRYTVTGGHAVPGTVHLSGTGIAHGPVDVPGFLARGVDHAAESAAKWRQSATAMSDPRGWDEPDTAPRARKRAPKRRLTPEFLQEVAEVYAAQTDHFRRTALVAEHYGAKPATAQGWIDRARAAGYIAE